LKETENIGENLHNKCSRNCEIFVYV